MHYGAGKTDAEDYRHGGDLPEVKADGKDCFDEVKDRIVYRLINLSRNEQYLKNAPFCKYLNFAIVFYVENKKGFYFYEDALVCDKHLAGWGVTKEELMLFAKENTRRKYCEQVDPMNVVIDMEEPNNSTLYYRLTNISEWYGATCILYDGLLKSLAENLGKKQT